MMIHRGVDQAFDLPFQQHIQRGTLDIGLLTSVDHHSILACAHAASCAPG